MSKPFLCDSCTVFGIPMSTTATIENGKCKMRPPCDNPECPYLLGKGDDK